MFARVKKSGKYQYLQIVENRKEAGKVRQQVIATLGRLDQLQEKGRVETLIRSLSRFSENTMLILSGKSDISADANSIGPVLIFERLWRESGIQFAIRKLLGRRRFVSFRRACTGLKKFMEACRGARIFTGRPAFFTGDEFWVSG